MSDYAVGLKGHCLEFIEGRHIYLCDGVILPSITSLLKAKFGGKYNGVSKAVLQRAAEAGTQVHDVIERYCKDGTESDLPELRNFKFLQRQYKFTVEANELPVILFRKDKPIAAGRLDMVIRIGNELGLADIKRTSVLDKDYLFYQLNLYRTAFQQCYDMDIDFLRGIHLRDNARRFVPIPVNPELAWEIVDKFMEAINE